MPRNETNDIESISGVHHEDIAATAAFLPTLPNIQARPVDRFAQAVRSIVEKRACMEWPNEGPEDVAVFLMVDHPRPLGDHHNAKAFADPIATTDPLLGRLFFANRDSSSGRVMHLPTEPNAILDWLQDNDLSSYPVILVYRQTALITLRPSGAGGLSSQIPIRDTPPVADLAELQKALQHFHIHHLLTPTCCPRGLWQADRAQHYIPGNRPEATIQSRLTVVLSSWFHGLLRAESEDRTNIGRIDVRLLQPTPAGPLAYWAIMELKVVKSFTNAATSVRHRVNEDAIVDGVRQAHAYHHNRKSELSLLEVYDLRSDKRVNLLVSRRVQSTITQFPGVSSIEVRALYGSANDARIAGHSGT